MKHAFVALTLALTTAVTAEARWSLDLKPIKAGTLTMRGAEGPGTYLYMICEVTNPSDEELPLRLGFGVETDVEGRTYRAGLDVAINQFLEAKLERKLPTLNDVRGTIDGGETREFLVTFGKIDPNVDKFHVQVSGLIDRIFVQDYKTWTEDRVLTLTYLRPGDELYRQYDSLRFGGRQWVVLGEAKELRRN